MSPHHLEDFVNYGDIVTSMCFGDESEEQKWVAESIRKAIVEDEIPPDEILVLHLNNKKVKRTPKMLVKIWSSYHEMIEKSIF